MAESKLKQCVCSVGTNMIAELSRSIEIIIELAMWPARGLDTIYLSNVARKCDAIMNRFRSNMAEPSPGGMSIGSIASPVAVA
jgi:hypothetical protein